MQWREWAGFYASSVYADFHDIEYNAIREAAALIDVSPLYKYRLTGRDALALVDRVITRDATKLGRQAPAFNAIRPACTITGPETPPGARPAPSEAGSCPRPWRPAAGRLRRRTPDPEPT